MTGPAEPSLNECRSCGRSLSDRAARLSDGDGCIWCKEAGKDD